MFSAWKNPFSHAKPAKAAPVSVRPLAYRRFMRTTFQASARLNLGGDIRQVQLLDMSLKGALVDLGCVQGCRAGTRGRLRLLLSPTTFIAMDVSVARVRGSQLGLQCTHIDLDSATHLRQLVERNAMDPTLLGRDLAVLIGSV